MDSRVVLTFEDACITKIPAVGTRSLLLLETRVSQEVDKTARTHQVSIGTLWWEKKKKLRRQSNTVSDESGIVADANWEEARGGNKNIYELAQDGKLESWN